MKQLKYNIKHRLEDLPISDYRRICLEIPKAIKKSRRTFHRYCNITLEEYTDIPSQDLDIIASYLGCLSADLKNYTIINSQLVTLNKKL